MIQVIHPTAYSEYKSLLLKLHSLLAAEKGRSEEARNVRHEMDMPERSLTDEEMDHLDGLSADLYMLQGKEIFEPGNVSGAELQPAWKEKRWGEVLQLLRKNIPGLREENRAYLRAMAYARLGDVDCAYLFMNHAASLVPDDVIFQYFSLDYLIKLKRFDTATEKANAYIRNPDTASPLLILSAAVLIQSVRNDSDISVVQDRFSEAYRVLTSVLSRSSIVSDTPAEVIVLGYLLLGFTLENLHAGDVIARRAYELAREIDPENVAALLGLLRLSPLGNASANGFQVPTEARNASPFTFTFDQHEEDIFGLIA